MLEQTTSVVPTEAPPVIEPPKEPVAPTPEPPKAEPSYNEEDAETYALGLAVKRGWSPPSAPQPAQPVKEELPSDFDEWAPGEQKAYLLAKKDADDRVSALERKFDERMRQTEGQFGRAQLLAQAKVGLPDEVVPYFDEAVKKIERENGAPLVANHPVMVGIIHNTAKALYFDSGAWKKNIPPGEGAVSSTAVPNPIPEVLKQAYKEEFARQGWSNISDSELEKELKSMGVVWG